jgi:uncharacterized membrane protein HdeD (DUF308 family)
MRVQLLDFRRRNNTAQATAESEPSSPEKGNAEKSRFKSPGCIRDRFRHACISSRREPLTSVADALIQGHRQTEATRKREIDMTTATIQPNGSNVWWIFLLQGIAAVLLGLMLLTAPAATLLTLVTFLGFYWIVSGVLSFVQMFVDRSVPWIWSLLIGIMGVAAGILVVRHPLVAALTVPTVIVIVFGVEGIVMGILELIGGFSGGGIGSFIRGAINLLIGLLLLSAPMAAALAVPFVFAVLLLVQGVALIALAFRVMNR